MVWDGGQSRPKAKKLFKQYDSEGTEDLDAWKVKFIELADPTEYTAGIALAGSWEAWEALKTNWPYFRNYILTEWIDEVHVKLRSEAIKRLISISGRDASAAKFLAEGRFIEKRVGRPSKLEVQRQAKIEGVIEKDATAEIERVAETSNLSKQLH